MLLELVDLVSLGNLFLQHVKFKDYFAGIKISFIKERLVSGRDLDSNSILTLDKLFYPEAFFSSAVLGI